MKNLSLILFFLISFCATAQQVEVTTLKPEPTPKYALKGAYQERIYFWVAGKGLTHFDCHSYHKEGDNWVAVVHFSNGTKLERLISVGTASYAKNLATKKKVLL